MMEIFGYLASALIGISLGLIGGGGSILTVPVLGLIDRDKTYYVHCAGGYRSMIFNSILRARGFDNLFDINGGFKALKDSGKFEISAYVCPSTMI